jgi:hypothetical protein
MFRPVTAALITLLRTLPAADWERQPVAGTWIVRDIVAHLLDTALRRLSFHRDGMRPPPPDGPIASDRDFVGFINRLNAQWVGSAKRLSPRVLTDLYERASGELADWFELLPLEAPALFPVSWAGEEHSAGWFDIGREFRVAPPRTNPGGGRSRLAFQSPLSRGRDRLGGAGTAARVS